MKRLYPAGLKLAGPRQDRDMESARATALDLISFIDASPSPYHAAAEALRRLTAAGFSEVDQAAEWPAPGGTC